MQGTAVAAFAKAGAVRVHERVTGTDPMLRRLAAHEANAAFLAGMGLDPAAVLGPPPVAPEPSAVRRRERRLRWPVALAPRAALAGG